jgi:RNA polymerase sigma-70 factor (ECF subfamily)
MNDLIPQLYRQEYSKMVSLICSYFGIDQIDAAEDIVSETFLSAAETWGLKGIPANPVGWLYKVARNNALNGLKRSRVFRTRVRGALSDRSSGDINPPELDLSLNHIDDSQLQMLFAVCHPSIPIEAQVSLALRVLCRFSIDEIARALLTTRANINKRLYRAKERLREENISIELPSAAALGARLDAVLVTLYLLFNEGYYSASPDKVLRKDLCLEAMRLVYLLSESPLSRPDVPALLALMCFQASRLEARMNDAGDLVLYEQQDRDRWDPDLIERGNTYFVKSCDSGLLSRYHLEAAIAWWHTRFSDSPEKWEYILMLYNRLLVLEYSPIAALNRAYAFARVYGKERAIPEALGLNLDGNLFYHSLLGELYAGIDDASALVHLRAALSLTTLPAERAVLMAKMTSPGREG